MGKRLRLPSRNAVVRALSRIVWAAAAGCLVGALGGWVLAQFLRLPQVDQLATFRPASTTDVLAADGSKLASFALEQRVELAPSEIPDHLKLAIVAIEDADFYSHGGVDPVAILRAAFFSLLEGRLGARGGASTLTQQLALNLFLKRERTLTRKAREALLAIDIEKRFSKDQILTMYANQIFLGHGAYGVEAAARLYFGKHASELDLAEAALLAGMIPSASNRYDPIRRPDAALARRNKVLARMLELGFIDRDAYATAVEAPLGATLHKERAQSGAYVLEMTRRQVEKRYGTEALYTNGLTIHLTVDPLLQRAAEEAVREGLVSLDMSLGYRPPPNVVAEGLADSPEAYEDASWRNLELEPGAMVRALVLEVSRRQARLRIGDYQAQLGLEAARWTGARSLTRVIRPGDLVLVRLPEAVATEEEPQALEVALLQEPELEGALVAIDNTSGAILALVGGYDFERSEFNRAVQSTLQCGSAFKPFVYLTAFQQGYTPADTLFDAPFLLPDGTGEMTYCPKNYYNTYYGITTLRRALELSFNATAVKTQQLVGGEAVVDTARRFGISTELHPYASLALGSLGVKLIDLVRAYSAIATLGELPEPYLVSEVRDRDDRVLERHFPHSERVMPASICYLMLHVLEGVVEHGTGVSAAALGAHLAGKTGTTDDYSDAWFIGFSPRITVGVWVGRDLKAPIGKKMTGARAAQPIWNAFVKSYLATLDEQALEEDFPVPPGVVFSTVDWYTGRLAVPACARESKVVLEAFLDGTEPSQSCASELHELHDMPWPFQQPFYEPRPGEPMPTTEALLCVDQRLEEELKEAEDGD